MKTHPAADRFPMFDAARLDELADDIKRNGLLHPIVTCDGMILDGRNRYKACEMAGIEPRCVEFTGGDPYEYAWSTNGHRRDLEQLQRAVIKVLLSEDSIRWRAEQAKARGRAAQSEKTRERPRAPGGTLLCQPVGHQADAQLAGQPPRPPHHPTAEAIAAEIDVSSATVQRAQAIVAAGRGEAVARGETKGMQALREIKRASLSDRVAALPSGSYRVIYADPPWKYGDDRAGLDVSDSAAAAHYPTMSVADLSALDVRSLAADDAVLFCWATFPLLPDALEVVRAWGFRYRTALVWDKGRPNLGNYHNACAELLLVCTRGSCTPDADGGRPAQVQSVPRGRHSEKPEEFRSLIDSMYRLGPRIELFCRGAVPASTVAGVSWTAWGNEVGAA